MEEKRLDFNAPLLSVRRIAAKNEPGTKTVGKPGRVPFTWEQAPGRPKDRILIDNGEDGLKIDEKTVRGGEDEVISSNELFFDCSGSDFSDSPDDVETTESFSKDRDIREFMMDRFLPAAKAMATGPLQMKEHQRSREKDRKLNYRRPLVSLPYQHTPNTVSKFAYDHEIESYVDEDEDEEYDYGGSSHFNRACGLIPRFCLKSSFLQTNSVPGMKVQSNLHPHSHAKVSDHGSLTQTEDESWDAVYKYKRGQRNDPLENESKLTGESNQLSYWSDSQMVDESSYHPTPQSSFREGNESLGVPRRELNGRKTVSVDSCERVCENYRTLRPCHGDCQRESFMSPSVNTSVYVADAMESPNSKSSSIDDDESIADKNCRVLVDDPIMEDSPVHGACEKHELQREISESVKAGLSSSCDRSNIEGTDRNNDGEGGSKVEAIEKNGAGLALSLLPPPLPSSPSESWLQRTLPSVSSKYPFTLLGIQVQHRKQRSWASPKDFNWENDSRALKRQPQLTRFTQKLTKPASLQYEP